MNPLILIGFLAFFVVALVVGVRLLALWWRTRELPELLMGIGVLGIGPVGFGLMMVGVGLMDSDPALGNAAFAGGTISSAAGVIAKAVFNWRVYRKRSPLAIAAALAIAGSLMVLGLHVMDGRWVSTGTLVWDGLLRSSAQVGCLLWGATESLLYWQKMKKRQRLGLADAVVVNRFLMWGIGAGFAGDAVSEQARWSAVNALLLLRRYRSAYDRLVDKLEADRGNSIGDCIMALEGM